MRDALSRLTSSRLFIPTIVAVVVSGAPLGAHNGPPFPVVTDRAAGSYRISLWADPDATDDGTADGRFWVTVIPASKGIALPPDTLVKVAIWPVDHPESLKAESAGEIDHEASRRFASFVIDHEGRYGVKATIEGPLGPAEVETVVDAAYDARPLPFMLILALAPFLLIGFVWVKLLLRRWGRT